MMIFIGTLFCNLHRDANGLYLRQTSVRPALLVAVSSIRNSTRCFNPCGFTPFQQTALPKLFSSIFSPRTYLSPVCFT